MMAARSIRKAPTRPYGHPSKSRQAVQQTSRPVPYTISAPSGRSIRLPPAAASWREPGRALTALEMFKHRVRATARSPRRARRLRHTPVCAMTPILPAEVTRLPRLRCQGELMHAAAGRPADPRRALLASKASATTFGSGPPRRRSNAPGSQADESYHLARASAITASSTAQMARPHAHVGEDWMRSTRWRMAGVHRIFRRAPLTECSWASRSVARCDAVPIRAYSPAATSVAAKISPRGRLVFGPGQVPDLLECGRA